MKEVERDRTVRVHHGKQRSEESVPQQGGRSRSAPSGRSAGGGRDKEENKTQITDQLRYGIHQHKSQLQLHLFSRARNAVHLPALYARPRSEERKLRPSEKTEQDYLFHCRSRASSRA